MWFIDELVKLLGLDAKQYGMLPDALSTTTDLVFEVILPLTILVLVVIVRGRVNDFTHPNNRVSVQQVKNLSDLFTEYLRQSERRTKEANSHGGQGPDTDSIKKDNGHRGRVQEGG